MNSNVLDVNIFNSINPDSLIPPTKKLKPFPLENFEEDLGVAYNSIDVILNKLTAAIKNPVNNTPAKQNYLLSMKYKVVTCKTLIKELAQDDSYFS
jgi:NH3-dependent NAD+ synthetase